jgi:uncharacterized protein (DUF2141 family)
MNRNCLLALAAVASYGLPTAAAAQMELTSNLNVRIDGLRNAEGQVCLKLFTGSQGFPNQDGSAIQRQCVAIDQIPLTVAFSDLTPGSYAIAIYHDRNSDEQLNRGAFGMPVEGYGFSNNPAVEAGPASFDEAVFFLVGNNTEVEIQMKYMP